MNNWEEVILGDWIKTNIESVTEKYSHEKILYLDTGSITSGKIDNLQELLLSEAPSRAKRIVRENDIIYSSVRPNQRHFGYITNPQANLVVSTGFIVISCDTTKILPKYLYYYLISDRSVEYLHTIAEGSTSAYPSLKPSDIESLKILLPPLPEQRAIAGVLSSLDDKIDLLHRQNQTLEALAQTLFRQWFIEEAEEDWEERPLSFFGEIVCGKTPSKKEPELFGGDIPFIKIPDMHGNVFIFSTTDTLSESGKNSQFNKTLPAKSICVSCIATVGLVSMNIVESQTNQQINSIIPNKPEYRYFLFLLMRRSTDLLTSMASGGTATLNLNTGNFSQINVLFPGEEFLVNFHQLIKPLFNKIFHNQSQIKTLEKLRNTLLPKLMSGEVRVQQK